MVLLLIHTALWELDLLKNAATRLFCTTHLSIFGKWSTHHAYLGPHILMSTYYNSISNLKVKESSEQSLIEMSISNGVRKYIVIRWSSEGCQGVIRRSSRGC